MACNSGTCQSGCYGDEPSVAEVKQRKNEESNRAPPGGDGVCVKCKVKETIAATHHDVGGDIGRFCFDCFRFNLFGKFRLTVTSNAMISPSDKVLVAFSGGCSSRVALQFVHEMQQKAQQNFDATAIRDRSLPVFGVGVAYISECSIYPVPSDEFNNRAINEMELIVSSLAPPVKDFVVLPTESIYDCSSGEDKLKLTELVGTVSDVTGKEDLSEYLRMCSLQKFALRNGYTKIVLGTCTSRIACHVLEATVKGQGFSLAADIQYVDARWKIPVVLPLRDCLSQELNLFCRLESLKIIEPCQRPRSGINGLISAFVKLLQEENPSRESTIMRTAGKLIPFSFNKIPEGNDVDNRMATKRRQKKYNLNANESLPPESFCIICCSPLKKSETLSSVNGFGHQKTNGGIYEMSCSSCQYQILPKDPSSLEKFASVLPQLATTLENSHDNHKMLRDQIKDFLLTDSDDGN